LEETPDYKIRGKNCDDEEEKGGGGGRGGNNVCYTLSIHALPKFIG
jgi:hypothetical protein